MRRLNTDTGRSFHGRGVTFGLLALTAVFAAGPASSQARPANTTGVPASGAADTIVAVVNGDAVTNNDVLNRERLLALSTGLPLSPEVLARLGPQVREQLIDEKMRLQEMQRRKVIIEDKEILQAIQDIEARNGLPRGALRARLSGQGVAMRTLIDQIRVQLGWSRVLREQFGDRPPIEEGDVARRIELIKEQAGQTEYNVGEIFIPAESPGREEEARHFADAVIHQLRSGAPFALVATQFSQSQTALEGGAIGWVQAYQLDPDVVSLLNQMPAGAISNPIRVAGGYEIVTLRGKREIGRDMATIANVRQLFIPFTDILDPEKPTQQQQQALAQAQQFQRTLKGCPAMEAAHAQVKSPQPANPGDQRIDQVSNPALRDLLAKLPPGEASRPLVARDGIMMMMVCERSEKNLGVPSAQEAANILLSEKIERTSRQLMGDLRRRSVIDLRG